MDLSILFIDTESSFKMRETSLCLKGNVDVWLV